MTDVKARLLYALLHVSSLSRFSNYSDHGFAGFFLWRCVPEFANALTMFQTFTETSVWSGLTPAQTLDSLSPDSVDETEDQVLVSLDVENSGLM